MQLIEKEPEPFILERDMEFAYGKMTELPPSQDVPLEYFIGYDRLMAFIFNNEFPPIVSDTVVVPLPPSLMLLAACCAALALLKQLPTGVDN
jgi:hypothetical protein